MAQVFYTNWTGEEKKFTGREGTNDSGNLRHRRMDNRTRNKACYQLHTWRSVWCVGLGKLDRGFGPGGKSMKKTALGTKKEVKNLTEKSKNADTDSCMQARTTTLVGF